MHFILGVKPKKLMFIHKEGDEPPMEAFKGQLEKQSGVP
jgi:hypothetical protein